MDTLQIDRLDHLVLTVADIEITCEFYSQALGMQVITFGKNRKVLSFGQQKINLHQHGHEFEPKAAYPTPGSADLCFITSIPLGEIMRHLESIGVSVVAGPVSRMGAVGTIHSLYLHDPDGNLIEISNYRSG